jgi:prolyl-tRNA synthetase
MKDSYSFDRDEAGLEVSFHAHKAAYERIWERCGLETYGVEAESGMMGGSESLDYLAPSGSGENTLVTCENGDYAADLEIARGVPRAPEFPEPLDAPAEIETPDTRTCEALAQLLSIDLAATSKAMPVTRDDGTLVLALLRGDDRLEEAKLLSALGADFRPATDEEIVAGFGAEGGSLGPVGFTGPVIADEALREGQFVAGANRTGWHLRGVAAGRDYEPEFADLRQPREGDACPVCGGKLGFQTAIEVGHIFKLGTKYSESFGAKYLDEDGVEKPIVMGSYGIGPGRVLAAAVEQHGGDDGMVWPREITPYDVHLVVLGWDNPELVELGEQLGAALSAEGLDVLLDDRQLRPGEKFADADLIGCPLRVTVGKKTLEDGAVDLKDRLTGDESRVASLDLAKRVVAR